MGLDLLKGERPGAEPLVVEAVLIVGDDRGKVVCCGADLETPAFLPHPEHG